jgi:hypothetical protein
MSEAGLVYPMLAMVVLTVIVLVILFRSRVRMVREGVVRVSYFGTFQGPPEPEYAAKPARHFANLFEAPVLFYVACLAALATGVKGWLVLALAWGYVAMRYTHAFIHLGSNRVRYRLRAYFVGWLLLLALWIHVAVSVALRH